MVLPDNNFVYEKGTLFVAPGGGGAPTPLLPGAANQALFANPSAPLGVAWGTGSAMGNVVGPVSSTAHHLAAFVDTTGELLEDSGIATSAVALGAGSSIMGHLMSFASTDGKTIADSGVVAALVALGVAGPVVNGNFASFNGTGGKQLQDSGFSSGSFAKSPVTGGAAATKGTFTLSSGGSGNISTTAVLTGSVVSVCVTTLGTVTSPQAMLVTISNGSHFSITSADNTDTSSGTWAIVA